MRVLRYFLPLLALVTLLSTNLNAMNESDNQKNVYLGWVDSEELDSVEYIEVPECLARHSAKLSNLLDENNLQECSPRLEVTITISREALEAVVDCLKIIDSENNLQAGLIQHICKCFNNNTMQDLVITAYNIQIGQFISFFNQLQAEVNQPDLDVLILQAKAHFEGIQDRQNSAIIIDVDDTALSRKILHRMIELHGIRTHFPYCQAYDPVKSLYDFVVSLGFKIFFLTARMEQTSQDLGFCDGLEATIHNLTLEGYKTFEKVICVPYEYRMAIIEKTQNNHQQTVHELALWKESERNKIAKEFTIVSTWDDTANNLQGDNVGFPVFIP